MKRPTLTVQKRELLGKKVKKLRREGILPANIYGKEITSTAVQVPYKDFTPVFKEVHQTGLVDVILDGKKHPVLIHNMHVDPVSHTPLHADFFEVNLKEKITTMVPVFQIGESKAVTEKVGILMQPISEIEVEALPTDLPEHIEVPVEDLAEIDQQLVVSDLKAPEGVTILTDPSQVVVKVVELVSEEAKEQAEEEAAAAEAAAAEGAEAPAEGTEGGKSEEKPAEEKPQE